MTSVRQPDISINRFLMYLLFIGFIPNMLGASFIFLYFRFLNITEITKELKGSIEIYSFFYDILFTVIIFTFVIIRASHYTFNAYRLLKKYLAGKLENDRVAELKGIILNTPLFVIKYSFLGWFLSASVITVSMHFKGMSLVNKAYFFLLIFIIAGSLALVTTYYLFDSLFRYVVPRIFKDENFSDVKGVGYVHINMRMLIAFWIGGLLPVIMIIFFSYAYLAIVKAGGDSAQNLFKYNALIILAFALSLFMTIVSSFYFSSTIGKPLLNLEKGMEKIKNGDFSVSMTVNQKDEMGNVNNGFNEMAVGLGERERIKEIFGKFVSSNIRDELLSGDVKLGGKNVDASIFFCDIRNFTTLSERMTAEDLVKFLNSYFNEMVEPIIAHDGVLDKFIGDAIMAIFGPPEGYENHAEKACLTALSMVGLLKIYNSNRAKSGYDPIDMGIGINTGNIIAGNIGNKNRMEYTVIGDAVNIASRVEGLSKVYGVKIVITENTLSELPPDHKFIVRELDLVMVKGRREPVLIYELMHG